MPRKRPRTPSGPVAATRNASATFAWRPICAEDQGHPDVLFMKLSGAQSLQTAARGEHHPSILMCARECINLETTESTADPTDQNNFAGAARLEALFADLHGDADASAEHRAHRRRQTLHLQQRRKNPLRQLRASWTVHTRARQPFYKPALLDGVKALRSGSVLPENESVFGMSNPSYCMSRQPRRYLQLMPAVCDRHAAGKSRFVGKTPYAVAYERPCSRSS